MRTLRGRVAVIAVAATAAALALSVLTVGATLVLQFRADDAWNWWGPWTGARTAAESPAESPAESSPEDAADGGHGFGFPGSGGFDNGAFDGPAFASGLVRGLAVINLGVLAVAGGAALVLTGIALRPLDALRDAAERVASTRDLATRLPEDGPAEVRSVANSVNAMLSRLQRSVTRTEETLEASRRFTADAGHELRTPLTSMRANLDVLGRSPNLSADERRIMVDVAREQARLLALLDGLQRLARADAADAVPTERANLADIVDAAVVDARRRHPDADITLTGPEDVVIDGWPDGLRLLVDNLVDNAVVHGGRRVAVTLVDDGVRGAPLTLLVDDDGPGIPADERERVFGRFVRGRGAGDRGSGLGLALVAQQAAMHGGAVMIRDAPLGGARLEVHLAREGSGGVSRRTGGSAPVG